MQSHLNIKIAHCSQKISNFTINNQYLTTMQINVEKTDIEHIGHTLFNYNGYVAISCYASHCGIERIMLRNILKCFGDEFAIIESEDDWNESCTLIEGVTYITNLPYETYLEL